MDATRSQTRAAKHERASARSAAETQKAARAGKRGWRWARMSACLIALAQQAVVLPPAALLMYRLLEDDSE